MRLLRSAVSGITTRARAVLHGSPKPATNLKAPAGVFDQERRVQHQVAARNVSALSAFDVVNVNYEDSLETPYGAPAVGRIDCSGQAHVVQATKEQEGMAQQLYNEMLSVLVDDIDSKSNVEAFRAAVQDAAGAGLLSVWPFRGSEGLHTNLVTCLYNIADLIYFASQSQRLQQLLLYLEVLLFSARTIHPSASPCLHEALDFLVDAYDLSNTSGESKARICRIMAQWGVMKIPVQNNMSVWSDEPQPLRIGMGKRDILLLGVGQLKQHRPINFTVPPVAAMQQSSPPATPSPAPPVCFEPGGSEEPTAPAPQDTAVIVAEAVAEALSKANEEKEKAVAEAVSKVIEEKDKVIRVLTHRTNDKFMVRNYCRRHTNKFHRDFNGDMLKKRQQKLEAETVRLQSSDFIDVCPLSSILASVDDGDDVFL